MTRWIFGLSIDDKIEWKLAKLPDGDSSAFDSKPQGPTYGALEEHPGELNRSGKLKSRLKDALWKFRKRQELEIWSSIRAIGVSSVGTIDRRKLKIVTVGMSHWLPHQEPILDLPDFFSGVFDDELLKPKKGPIFINVRNETTAKCLAEWHKLPAEEQQRDEGFSIFYVLFSEGVNAAFVSAGRPVFMPLNTEMGHMYPRPHVADLHFDENQSGCGRHTYCFEGLASLTRIRKSWGEHVPFAEMEPEAHDRIAYYMAQMCLNGIVTLAQSRILLGGPTFFEGLVPLIQEKIELFNRGRRQEPYVAYPDMRDGKFIRMASIPPTQAGVAAALALAHQAVLNPDAALAPTGNPRKPAGGQSFGR